MIDYKILKQQLELLPQSTVVLIAGHKNADYDSITSCIALAKILSKLGYTAYALIEKADMDKTYWLDTSCVLNTYDENQEFNFIMLDANRKERLGRFEQLFDNARTTICIDHHEGGNNESKYSFIDKDISSTAEIISHLANEIDDPLHNSILDEEISTLLYAGIAADTNSFYKRVTSQTMLVASMLLYHGANGTFAIKNVCKNLCLREATILSKMFNKIQFDSFHYVVLDRHDDFFKDIPYSTIFKKCAAYLYELIDVNVFGLFLIELDGSVSGVLRSNCDINVDGLATEFGGGGHKKAAGFETYESIEVILAKVKSYVQEQM